MPVSRNILATMLFLVLVAPASARGLSETRTAIVAFENSPFPYRGEDPETHKPFLDVAGDTRSGHSSPRGGTFWEDVTYSDRRVLIAFPKGFTLTRPVLIVVYFHGNSSILERDVVARQHIPEQLAASGLNAVLLAPQFARDALDSSAGNFWTPGSFARFLDEASGKMAELLGVPEARGIFARAPVVLVAYSGGYDPAAYALAVGGAGDRVKGVMLFDALYDETDKFADWIATNANSGFFFSAYSHSSEAENAKLADLLRARGIPFLDTPPRKFTPGTVSLFAFDRDDIHEDFMTDAWVHDPVAWSLRRIPPL